MEPKQQAWSGTISGRRARIELRGDTAPEGWPRLGFLVIPGLGQPILMPPSEVQASADGTIFTFALPSGFIRSIRTHLLREDGTLAEELPYAADYEIRDLMPASLKGVLPVTFMRKNRIRHLGTLQFMAEQVSCSEEYNPFVQIEAVKVLSYMSIEEGSPELVAWALDLIDRQFSRINWDGARKGTSKEHPLHITISLRFIRLLALLTLGRYEEALAEMVGFDTHVDAVASTPIIAFNLSLGLVLHGWILVRGGDTQAAIPRLQGVIATFRAAAQSMPAAKSKIFAELGMALQGATVAIDLINGSRGRLTLEWDGYHGALRIAKRFSRLTTSASQERFAAALEAAAEMVAVRRAPEGGQV
jgi:hypothetical protein